MTALIGAFLVSVAAGITVHIISKWLDRNDKNS